MSNDGQTISLADGRRIGYAAIGPEDGQPIVHCHGGPGSRLDAAFPGLEQKARELGARIFFLERPGYGLSDRAPKRRVVDWADDVRQFADALGIDSFAVVGYSAGGPHALACAARLGERVTKVAAISSVGVPGVPGEFDGMGPNERLVHRLVRISPLLVGAVYRLARRNAMRNPERFFSDFEKDCSESDRAVLADTATRDALQASVIEALRRGVGGIVDDWVVCNRRPWGFEPEEIKAPAFLIFGDADRIVPVAQPRDLARRIAHAKVVEVPGEGHLLILPRFGELLRGLQAAAAPAAADAT